MAEPGFYVCRACGAHWRRMELKLGPNPPPSCPHCKADSQRQDMDDQREREYVRAVYSPVAQAIGAHTRPHWVEDQRARIFCKPYLCYVCRNLDANEAATIRAFCGTGGGGYPACQRHAPRVLDLALRTLLGGDIDRNWRVVVREVITNEDGYPVLGRVLFTARPRNPALQGVFDASDTVH